MSELRLRPSEELLVGCELVRGGGLCIFHDFKVKLFDDWIGEHLARDLLDFGLGGGAIETSQIEDEKLALADVADGRMAKGRQGVLYGGALRIEHGTFQHDPDMCFHGGHYIQIAAIGGTAMMVQIRSTAVAWRVNAAR
jgi:hypothetical protein